VFDFTCATAEIKHRFISVLFQSHGLYSTGSQPVDRFVVQSHCFSSALQRKQQRSFIRTDNCQ